MLVERAIFTHDDRSVRPIVIVKTEGPVYMESSIQHIMVAMYDFNLMRFPENSLGDKKLFTKIKLDLTYGPLEGSYRSIGKQITLIPSSEITYELDPEDNHLVVLKQNYQIMTHNQRLA